MRSRQRKEPIALDLTSLIDVVFLLIIFFLVTSVFKPKNQVLGLNLPQTLAGNAKKSANEKSFIIELNSKELAVNGEKVLIDQLGPYLSDLEKNKVIELRIEKDVAYQRLVKLLDLLKKKQLANISLVTLKASSSSSK